MVSGHKYNQSRLLSLGLSVAFLLVGCGEEEAGPARVGRTRSKAKPASAASAGAGGSEEAVLVLPELTESRFIASPKTRDPFKVFGEVVARAVEVRQTVQREVKLKEFDISELRLIGIITNIGDPRAMVTTPEGTGFVLRRGDYVGRADYIDAGSGGDKIQVNWRIARIHGSGKEDERGIYMVRDDPTAPAGKKVNRFMALHPQD